MLPLKHLLSFLLAPAAVLSAPHRGSNDGISKATSPAFNGVNTLLASPRASFHVDPRHVIELRHDQLSADTLIHIPSDQMSGTVRVHFDPDLEPSLEANGQGVSKLVKRDKEGIALCANYRDHYHPDVPHWDYSYGKCVPEKSKRSFQVHCKNGLMTTTAIEGECPEHTICYQKPEIVGKGLSDFECRPEGEVEKASSSTVRGIVKTVKKLLKPPPRGYKKLLFESFSLDRNSNLMSVKEMVGISDEVAFATMYEKNSLFHVKEANTKGEAIYFLADPGNAFITLEWSWKRLV